MKGVLLAFAVSALGASAVNAATMTGISNGSFENPDISGAVNIAAGGLPGWNISPEGVQVRDNFQSTDGDQVLNLHGLGGPGSISQVFSGLSVGNAYKIDFSMSSSPWNSDVNRLSASILEQGMPVPAEPSMGAPGQIFSHQSTSVADGGTATPLNMQWEEKSFTFIANGTTQTLSFFSLEAPRAVGPMLDNVRFTELGAVPIPATALMLLAGVGALGAMRRRKS